MFEDLLRTVRHLNGTAISVPIDLDADGYWDRQCPATECEFLFKVHAEDWRNIVKDEAVWCPFCGHRAASNSWWTQEQLKKAEQAAYAELTHRMSSAMRRDAERFNRRQSRGSFISISMKVDAKPKEIVLPAAATEPMQLKITCPQCTCRYAVIGSGYFCAACGHNAADFVFAQSLGTIRATLDNLVVIAAGLPNRDSSENIIRLLTEDSLQRIVTAFQRFVEAMYDKQPSRTSVRRNAFQNLDEGSRHWKAVFGNEYDAYLSRLELLQLKRYFQQRHLLAHREGLVDADYIARTGDQTYREGQRLVVREVAVRECLALVEALASGLAADAERVGIAGHRENRT